METTWKSIVWSDNEDTRACVYCGCRTNDPRKSIPVAHVERILARQCPELRNDIFSRTMHNICEAANTAHAYHTTDSEKPSEACFITCLCCHHWVERRFKQNIFVLPLQALFWYTSTVRAVSHKNMDHRVVRRLCISLCVKAEDAATNFYWCMFGPAEQRIFAALSVQDVEGITNCISLHYHEQNAGSMFTTDCRTVERLRKALHEPPAQ